MDGLGLNDLQKLEELVAKFGLASRRTNFPNTVFTTVFDDKLEFNVAIEIGNPNSSYLSKGRFLFLNGKFVGLDPK